MTKPSLVTLGGAGAIAFASAIFLTNILILTPAGLPLTGAAGHDVRTFFGSQGDGVALGAVFMPLAWICATVFGAGAFAAVRAAKNGAGEAWALLGLGGLVAQNVTFAVVTALRLGMASAGEHVTSTGLWGVHEALFTLNGTFLALALLGLSISGSRSGLIGSWLTAAGLAAASLNLLSASLTPVVMAHVGLWGLIGLAGWLLWVLWLLGFGGALIRRSWRGVRARPR